MHLVITLGDRASLELAPIEPIGVVDTEHGSLPEGDTLGGFLGFYDWLRSETGCPVAIRITFCGLDELAEQLSSFRCVKLEVPGVVRIRLLPSRPACEHTADQHMGAIHVFGGANRAVITVEARDISPTHLDEMIAAQKRARGGA